MHNAFIIIVLSLFSVNGFGRFSSLTGAIAGNTAVCQHSASPVISFSGANGSAPYTFTYSINNGANQTITATGNTVTVSVSTAVAGSFVYKLISVSDNGSAVFSPTQNNIVKVTVNQAPVVLNTIETICSGTAFSIAPSGVPAGTTYTWAAPVYNGPVSGGSAQNRIQPKISQNLVVSGLNQGTATYTVVPAANGCIGNKFTITARVVPLPVVNNMTTVAVSGTAFDLTPVQVPSATTYTWAMPKYTGAITGGTAQGSGRARFSETLYNNGAATATYKVVPTNGGCSGKTFTAVINLNISSANVWTSGAGTTDWFNPGNWSLKTVPTALTDAVVPTGVAGYPVLMADAAVKSLEIQKDGEIGLNGKMISVYGNITGTGIFTGSSASAIALNGTATTGTLYFNQSTDSITNVLKDLTINTTGAYTVGNRLYITHQLASNAGTLYAAGNLTLRSTGLEATAQVLPVRGTISGDVTVERFISKRRAYRFISPAVTTTTSLKANWMENVYNPDTHTNNNPKPGYGTHITSYAGHNRHFDETVTDNPSIFTFDNASQLWSVIANTDSTLQAGNPYRVMVRGSRAVDLNNNASDSSVTILRTTGGLLAGTVTFDNSNAGPVRLNAIKDNFSFIGNPYAGAVDWDQMVNRSINPNNTARDIAYTYYAWDPNINTRGAYVTYNSTYGQNSNAASAVDKNIQPGQAFIIQATGANPSLTFMEKYKTTNTTSTFRVSLALTKLSIQLFSNASGTTPSALDGVVAVYSDKFSHSIGDEDSYKFSNEDENLAINRNGVLLSMEGRLPITANDTLPLKIWQFRQKEYSLKLTAANFSPFVSAFVKDAYLNKETPIGLASVTTVPFSITADTASFAANRFSIIFKAGNVLPVTITNARAYAKDKGISVEWISETETNIQNYEVEKSIDGATFTQSVVIAAKGNNAVSENYSWFDARPVSGNNFYRIKITNRSGAIKYSQIVNVNMGKSKSGITVFPNPVTGNVIGLQLNNLEKGTYHTGLYNNLGQKVYTGKVEHAGGSGSYSLSTGVQLSRGVYTLQVINGDKTTSTKVVVE